MANLYFLRHAQSELNKQRIFAGRIECHITEEGKEKAIELGKKNEIKFDIVYCSPMIRTRETLECFYPGSNPIIDNRLIEASAGSWEGKFKEDLDQDLILKFRQGIYVPEAAEPVYIVDKRVREFVVELFEKYTGDENILIVTHNQVIRAIKRMFIKEHQEIYNNNLSILKLTNENYEYFKESRK